MKMNKILSGMAAAALCCTAFVSCTKNFDDYNTNKHEATYEQMNTDDNFFRAFFMQLQRSVITFRDGTYLDSDYQIMYNLSADTWAGYLAPTLGRVPSTGNFYIIDGWTRSLFVNKYNYAMNAWNQLDQYCADADRPQVAAIGNILKVTSMHQVADAYGPIPYSEVGKSVAPKYDDLRDVYHQMLSELDGAIEALTDFANGNPGASVMAENDFVYGGDIVKWIKFANSLRLRLAMRIVYAEPDLARQEAEKSITQQMGVMTEAGDIAALTSIVPHHPIYEINVNFNDADTQINANLDCYLNGYNDPRISKFMKPASDGKYHGVRNGIEPAGNRWDSYKNASGKISAPNATLYKIVWMNPAEVWFLRAEGALRGWNMGVDAKTAYENGIAASFEEWGVTGADRYAANTDAVPAAFVDNAGNNGAPAPSSVTIAWNDGADFETSLEKIMTQKWIALFPNGSEAWAEYRRTRYPKLLTVAINESNGIVDDNLQIRRIPYPVSEYSTNAKGVAQGVAYLGTDNAGTKLWWDKKD